MAIATREAEIRGFRASSQPALSRPLRTRAGSARSQTHCAETSGSTCAANSSSEPTPIGQSDPRDREWLTGSPSALRRAGRQGCAGARARPGGTKVQLLLLVPVREERAGAVGRRLKGGATQARRGVARPRLRDPRDHDRGRPGDDRSRDGRARPRDHRHRPGFSSTRWAPRGSPAGTHESGDGAIGVSTPDVDRARATPATTRVHPVTGG